MAEKAKLRNPVECNVFVDEKEIKDLYPFINNISVEMNRKAAAVCTLDFNTVRENSGKWNIQDSGVFRPWKKIRVDALFGNYREEVFRGYIRDIVAEYPETMNASFLVNCQDESLVLDRDHVRTVFSYSDIHATDGELIRRITSQYWTDITAREGLTTKTMHHNGTLIRFIMNRAEANGFEFLVREGKVYFGPSRLDAESQSPIMVYAGNSSNCKRFKAWHDGHKPDQIRLDQAFDRRPGVKTDTFTSGNLLLGKNSAGSLDSGLTPFVWIMDRTAGDTSEERIARAKAMADEMSWKLVAEGELDGALYGHVLLTHRNVSVDGVGDTFGGLWYVDEVKHVFSSDDYRQAFRLIRNATGERPVSSKVDRLFQVRAR